MDFTMEMKCQKDNQDYQKSGFAKNIIALGSICVPRIYRFPFEHKIPGVESRLPEIPIRRKYNCIGFNICGQNILIRI